MKLRPVTVIVSLLLLLSTTPSLIAATTPEDRWLYGASGYARALQLQREMKLPLVVYFYTDWCPYCHALDNDYLPAAPVQQYLRGVVKVRINPESGPAERDIAKQYRVRGYPSFFIMRNESSAPVDIQPFRRGKNLTPAEWVTACQQAESFSARTNKSPFRHNSTSATPTANVNVNPTRQKLKRRSSRRRLRRSPTSPFRHSTLCSLNMLRRSAAETHNAGSRAA